MNHNLKHYIITMHFKVNKSLEVEFGYSKESLLMILTPMKITTVRLKQYKNVSNSCISLIILHC